MNRFEKIFGGKGEATVKYLDGDFEVITPGDYVRCAITNQPIALDDLRYWSVNRQEAYANAEISLKSYLEHAPNRS